MSITEVARSELIMTTVERLKFKKIQKPIPQQDETLQYQCNHIWPKMTLLKQILTIVNKKCSVSVNVCISRIITSTPNKVHALRYSLQPTTKMRKDARHTHG